MISLLAAPALAIMRMPFPVGKVPVVAAWFILSAITFWIYHIDKRRAEQGDWRVPEANLHLLSLLGGWPGALFAQILFRHKTAKNGFQVIFWSTVILHQTVAVGFLLNRSALTPWLRAAVH